jgi:hypothetical protein
VAGVDLEEDGKEFALLDGEATEALSEGGTIDGLDAVEGGDSELGLIGLQMADQFPAKAGRGGGALLGGLLDAILGDGGKAEAGGVEGGLDRMGLGHGQDADGGGVATGNLAGRGDAGDQGLGVNFELRIGDHLFTIISRRIKVSNPRIRKVSD